MERYDDTRRNKSHLNDTIKHHKKSFNIFNKEEKNSIEQWKKQHLKKIITSLCKLTYVLIISSTRGIIL